MSRKVFLLVPIIFTSFISFGNDNHYLSENPIKYNVNSSNLNVDSLYDLDFYNYQHDNFSFYILDNDYNNELKLFEIVQDGGQILESDDKAPEGNYIKIITESNDLLDITYYSISDEDFTNISNNSLSLDLLDKDERAKILEAHSYESNYRSSSAINESSGISLLSSNNASLIDYKDYTSSDGAIDEFIDINEKNEPTYVDKFNDNRYGSDNLIVNIIPKELFTKINKTYSIGGEYGFYINTYNSGRYLESNYIVFDVDVRVAFETRKYTYISIDVPINGFSKYDKENDVVFSYSEGSNLAVTNIESNISICNENGFNPGNSDYNIENDYGAFFNAGKLFFGASIHYNEIGLDDIVEIILKYINFKATIGSFIPNPLVSSICTMVSEFTGILSDFIDDFDEEINFYFDDDDLMDKDVTDENYFFLIKGDYSDSWEHYINNNYNFPRNFYENTFHNIYEETNQLLMLKQKEDFYEYKFNIQSIDSSLQNSLENTHSIITHLYTLDIIQDNGNYQEVTFLTHMGMRYDILYSSSLPVQPKDSIVTNKKYYISFPNQIDVQKGAKLNFTPKETDDYIISFVGDVDAQINIYDSKNNLVESDKNSGYGNNPLVITNLKANNTYPIYVSSDDYEYNAGNGYFQIFRYSTGYNMDGMTNSAIPMQTTTSNSDPAIYKLTPTTEGRYSIFTSQGSSPSLCDTYLELYDEQFRKLAFNDNFVGNYSKVEWYLEKQKTYYIAIKNKSSGSRQFKLNIIDDQVIHEKNFGNPITLYTVCSTYKRYSYITLYTSKSSTRYFYTENLSGHKDITLTIYDDKMNQIAFDDDSRGNNQPYISVYLQANRYYYLFIKMIINGTYAPSSVFNLVIGG